MGIEIERKFLVMNEDWRQLPLAASPRQFLQGYLALGGEGAPEVRVRVSSPLPGDMGREEAFLTIKGKGAVVRAEFEQPMAPSDARELLNLAQGIVLEKVRYAVQTDEGLVLEIDVYGGDLAGLVVAEVELPSVNTPFAPPAFLGAEVSEDRRYKNASLAAHGMPTAKRLRPG